ncbi:thiol reductase thioredoxin [Oceanobacillus sp. 143]|jgi:thiol-disulfide isomerase/thioredoxin|uniref:Thiol reductase thioredoxin n=1 Tax=Oceanobacillus zhaokaii TaxID=2052660 RepID=A0A345PIA9_9BACI|nr:thioredoxin family protein [Oceanobacillus zhaokaii]AXI09739.1 thiol reductase thioredoxin [Oceanobacillus zhaokaii]QGS69045.1 thiol reductase thioredoxin [Oceanobacillus sp. 143]
MKQLESIEQYNELVQNENVIMMFSADWCGDCRYIEPELPEIEKAFPEYTFVHVDRDKFIEICQEHGIMGIPSFLAYKDGKEAGRFVSKDRKTKEEITSFIEGLSA